MILNLDLEDKETDVLKLSVEEWTKLLKNPDIFNDNLLKEIVYIYKQPNHESTASDIGKEFGVDYRTATRWYVEASNDIYYLYNKDPLMGSNGQLRLWNTLFILLKDQKRQRIRRDGKTLYRLILRPNLATAMEQLHLV